MCSENQPVISVSIGLMTRRGGAIATLILALSGQIVAQPPKSLDVVNAGSGASVVAPDSIASATGKGIGSSTGSANPPLPTILNGGRAQMTDTSKTSFINPVFYISPNPIQLVSSAAAG